ncbi:MAG TPA: thioredoxin family protein [Myxococcota bacterium]
MKHDLPLLDDVAFDAAIAATTTDRAVLVDFTAPWCPPCDALKPVLGAVAAARTDVQIAMLDVDDHPDIAGRYGVRAMPTLLLFRGGRPAAQLVGAVSQARLERWLTDALR